MRKLPPLLLTPTTLHPTTEQADALSRLTNEARDLHLWVRRFLRLRGAGVHLSLHDALRGAASGADLPEVDDARQIQVPYAALDELRALQFTTMPDGWRHVPRVTACAIIRANLSRLKARTSARAGQLLPLLPLTAVPVDGAAQILDDYHALIDGVGPVICDTWALPADLMGALLLEADERSREARRSITAVRDRILSGDAAALSTLYASAAAVTQQARRLPATQFDPGRPHRVAYARLTVTTDPDGQVRPVIEWSVRVPWGHRPRAVMDDTLGVDLGVRHLVTLADARAAWPVPRPTHLRELPAPDPSDAAQLLLHARMRREVLEAARPGLEAALDRALTYRRVNVEDLNYVRMREHGGAPWAPAAMRLSGAALWPTWLELLAEVTGTQVRRVDPAGTSSACPHPGCRLPLDRPAPYDQVRCPAHGPMDADVAGARGVRLL